MNLTTQTQYDDEKRRLQSSSKKYRDLEEYEHIKSYDSYSFLSEKIKLTNKQKETQ